MLFVCGPDQASICEVATHAPETSAPNARLISAAPDLLEASKAVLGWLDNLIDLGFPTSPHLLACRLALMAAIAAAEPQS
jgi:hypothetical protein